MADKGSHALPEGRDPAAQGTGHEPAPEGPSLPHPWPGQRFPGARARDARAELRARGFVPVRVDGDCMAPSLRRGESVVVRAGLPRPGEVALLDASGWLEIHRIIRRVGPWYIHMGDSSDQYGLAGAKDILGLVPVGRPRRSPAIRAHAAALALHAAAAMAAIGLRPLLAKVLSRISRLP